MALSNKWLPITTLILTIAIAGLIDRAKSIGIEVLVNDTAYIRCFPNKPIDIQWHHTPPNEQSKFVYAGGTFYGSYRGRFETRNDSTTNTYVLIIHDVRYEDAGLYECKDDYIAETFGSTQMTVLDSSPVCTSNMNSDGFVGPNTCNLEQENMTFNCVVSFNGNRPQLIWSSLNDSQSLQSPVCDYQSNRVSCRLTLGPDPKYDGSVFICQTVATEGARHNCSSEVIKIQYFSGNNDIAERKVNDNVSCIAKSNLQTRYKWTLQQDNKNNSLSSSQTILIQKPGVYQCDAEYNIRNTTCFGLVSVVNVPVEYPPIENVTEISGVPKEQGDHKTVTIVVVVVVLVIFVCVLVGLVIWKRKSITNRIRKCCFKKKKKINGDIEVEVLHPLRQKQPEDAEDGLHPGEVQVVNQIPQNEENVSISICKVFHLFPEEANLLPLIRSQKQKLQEIMDPEFGLLADLVATGALTPAEKDETNAKNTTFSKNEVILDIILNNGKHREFITGLENSGQTHVVNWIEADGVYKDKFGLIWPLREKEMEFINSNYKHLGDTLDINVKFLETLESLSVINQRHVSHLKSKAVGFERNECFLDILRRLSLKAYHYVTKCIRDSKQENLARALEEGGNIVPIHITLEGQNVEEIEEKVVKEFKKLSTQNNESSVTVQLTIIGAKRGNSVVLCVCCYQNEEFGQLCEKVENKQMIKILEDLFIQLSMKTKVISVTIYQEDKEKATKSFECEKNRDKTRDEYFRGLRSQLKYPITKLIEDNWKEILKTNYADLLVQIDSNTGSGLDGELRKSNAFHVGMIKQIWGFTKIIDRNKKILDLLERGDFERFNAFRKALLDSGQKSVVDKHMTFIKEHLKTPDNRYNEPLKECCRQKLQIHWNDLVGDIQIDQVIPHLKTRSTLTDYQQRILEDLLDNSSKTIYLLQLLETGSQQHFDDFCESLKKSNQSNIVTKYLTPETASTKLGTESTQQQN